MDILKMTVNNIFYHISGKNLARKRKYMLHCVYEKDCIYIHLWMPDECP